MKKIGYVAGLLAIFFCMITASVYAQSYKMFTGSANQQVVFGTASLGSGSVTVSVLPSGTVTAACGNFNALSGSNTATLKVTFSGGNITLNSYNTEGIQSTASVQCSYIAAGTP